VKALEILLRAREKPAEDPWQIRKEQGPRGIDLGDVLELARMRRFDLAEPSRPTQDTGLCSDL
jgi:hypothetical protein